MPNNLEMSVTKKESFTNFLNECWIFPPSEITKLDPKFLNLWSKQIAAKIEDLSHGHMLPYSVEQAQSDLLSGLAMVLTTPNQQEILSYIKKSAWPNHIGTACWEVGSIFTDPLVQNMGVGKHMLKTFSELQNFAASREPVIAVVTDTNLPSLHIFRSQKWLELHPEAQETGKFLHYDINGANIYEDWGYSSSIFFHPQLLIKNLK